MTEMSPLRRRMIQDMTVRNLSPATQRSYVMALPSLVASSAARLTQLRVSTDARLRIQIRLVHRQQSAGQFTLQDHLPIERSLI
jgi:hypothetical protein